MNPRAPSPRPVVLGVIGGIGSGKSTAAAALAEAGATVLDADQAVRDLFETAEVQAELQTTFGPGVLADGRVDRAALAERVFGDATALARLEAILHPRVQARMGAALDALVDGRKVPAVVLDVPLLLEKSPLKKRCDLLIFVDCPADIRGQRVEELRGWSAGELARRETHQWSAERKRQAADVVFLNEGSLDDLRCKIREWLTSAGGFAGLPRRTPTSSRPAHDRPSEPSSGAPAPRPSDDG